MPPAPIVFKTNHRIKFSDLDPTMADAAGKTLSRCLMTVACVDKQTNRAIDWPPDAAALFFERDGG